jgi:hypothetical protein
MMILIPLPLYLIICNFTSLYVGVVSDVQDAQLFKDLVLAKFGIDKYAFYWHLGADGVTLDANQSKSVIPIILTLFNYPPERRTKPSFAFVVGLVPVGCSNLELFLNPILEELKATFDDGFQVHDCVTEQNHVAHNILLCSVFDLRGLPKVTCNTQAPAALACHVCDAYGNFVKSGKGKKGGSMVYEGAFAYLEACDPLRAFLFERRIPVPEKLPVFFRHVQENDTPPTKKKHDEILQFGAESEARQYGAETHKKNGQHRIPFIAAMLRYFDLVRQIHVDIMHECENMARLMAKCMLGHNQAAWAKVKPVEHLRGKWLDSDYDAAPYALSPDEIAKFNRELKAMRLPRTHGKSLRQFLNPSVYIHLSAHDWKVMMGDIIIYLVRDLNPVYRRLWVDLCLIFKRVHSYSITEETIASLRRDIPVWIAHSEFLLPTKLSTIVQHYMYHIPDTLFELGPGHTTWMYGNETLNGILTSISHSSHSHERSIIKKWILYKLAFFNAKHLGDAVPVVVQGSPSTWSFSSAVDRECEPIEKQAFLGLLGLLAGPNCVAVTKKIFSGRKVFQSYSGAVDGNAFKWTMGKCTAQVRSAKYPLQPYSVNGFLYVTVHGIYIYLGGDGVRHVFFKCCVWKAKYSHEFSLVKVRQPLSFEEVMYVNATDVTTNVCLFLPRNSPRVEYDHLVAVVTPDFCE